MQVVTFAAIVIGSNSVDMKIFEFGPKRVMKEITSVESSLELGKDAYVTGKISVEKVEEICSILKDYQRIMKEFGVSDYKACCTSALRETKNRILLVDYIEKQTNITLNMLSNSEQRFIDYKSIASISEEFDEIMRDGTAFVDVGGGSIQFSVFEKDSLVATQNMRLGTIRLREKVGKLEREARDFEEVIKEAINNHLMGFKNFYLKDREIKNLIIVGECIRELLEVPSTSGTFACVPVKKYIEVYNENIHKNPQNIAEEYAIPSENASLIRSSMIIYRRIMEEIGAEKLWLPVMELTDGIAYDYAQRKKMIRCDHDFTNDIIASARMTAKRYQCGKEHIKEVENLGLQLFDRMKKIHGMGSRERLLLQIAIILHSCGKYISLNDRGDCVYSIIMATEIIGLSHEERKIVANIVKYNNQTLPAFDQTSEFQAKTYLTIAKLVAMLRIANALDRSHRQKIEKAVMTYKEKEGILVISVTAHEDMTLETGLFPEKAELFEEVFAVRPEIKVRKLI